MAYQTVIPKLPPGPDIDLLLMGNTGNGKSSTGNSILGRKEFNAKGGAQAATKVYRVGYSTIDGRVIKVVDTPGLCDTEAETEEEEADLVVNAFSGSLRQFPQGLTCLVLVLKYTLKFTSEVREAIETFKKILGNDIIKNHTVCVITEGENFWDDHEGKMDFETWCKTRTGRMKNLLEECQYRCVLFENSTKDPTIKSQQLFELIYHIDRLSNSNDRYTFDKFKSACQFVLGDEKVYESPVMVTRDFGMMKDNLDTIMNLPLDQQNESLQMLSRRLECLQNEIGKDIKINIDLSRLLQNIKRYNEHLDRYKGLSLKMQQIREMNKPKIERQAVGFRETNSSLEYLDKELEKHRELLRKLANITTNSMNDTDNLIDEARKTKCKKTVIPKLPPGPDIDLLLMGKTGNGKSSTGNSILGRKEFKAKGGAQAVQKVFRVGYSTIDGRVIKVVDAPGLCDTEAETEEEEADLVVNAVSGSLRQFPQGLTCLVWVMRYTSKFTIEEREAIKTLKKILGDDIIKNHTVCVITEAENFWDDHEGKMDFETWCKTRTGEMKNLLEECQYRCVLFDNSTKDPTIKSQQLFELIYHIDCLSNSNDRYTFDKFKSACKFELGEEKVLKLEKISRENGLIKDDLHNIMNGPADQKHESQQKLLQRVEVLQKHTESDTEMNVDINHLLKNVKRYNEELDRRELLSQKRQGIEKMTKHDVRRQNVIILKEKNPALQPLDKDVDLQDEWLTQLMETLLNDVDKIQDRIDEKAEKTAFGKGMKQI